MTDPIAVDAPVKPAYSRSVPLGLPSPSLAPTPELRVDPPKPAATATTAAATVAAAALGVPPVPVATAAPAAKGFLARFTKRQLVIGATAAVSLFAGVGAVRLMFPAKDDATPVAASGERVVLNTPTPAPTPDTGTPKPPAVEVIPSPSFEPLTPPPLPTTSVASARPTSIQPITPLPLGAPLPTIHPDPPRHAASPSPSPSLLPLPVPAPDFTPPALPLSSPPDVRFASGSELPKPPIAPPTPGLPPIPTPGAGGTLPLPTPKSDLVVPPAVTPKLPDPGSVVPPVSPKLPDPTLSPFPAPGGLVPLPKNTDPAPAPKPADSALPLIPAPGGVSPLPKTADPAPTVTPDLFPAPKFEVKPSPQPEFKPPAIDPRGGFGTPTGFAKPAGETEAKPAAPAFAPKTTFDVDIHNPAATDTYETISQEFYNDKRFAAALKAYNQNQPLQGGRYVNVPPIHVLKRQFPNLGGAATPVGGTGAAEWGAAPARPAAGARNSFVVPQGGMTLQEIARHTTGNQQRWQDIYELNRQFTDTAAVIPAGTELKLPPDARVP